MPGLGLNRARGISGSREHHDIRVKRSCARDINRARLRVRSCSGCREHHDIRVKRSGARDINRARLRGVDSHL